MLGFRSLGFRVQASGFRVRVQGVGFRASIGIRMKGLGFSALGFHDEGSSGVEVC